MPILPDLAEPSYISNYKPIPVELYAEVGKHLQDQYEKGLDKVDAFTTLMNQFKATKDDTPFKEERLNYYKTKLNDLVANANGRYENIGRGVSKLANEYTNEVMDDVNGGLGRVAKTYNNYVKGVAESDANIKSGAWQGYNKAASMDNPYQDYVTKGGAKAGLTFSPQAVGPHRNIENELVKDYLALPTEELEGLVYKLGATPYIYTRKTETRKESLMRALAIHDMKTNDAFSKQLDLQSSFHGRSKDDLMSEIADNVAHKTKVGKSSIDIKSDAGYLQEKEWAHKAAEDKSAPVSSEYVNLMLNTSGNPMTINKSLGEILVGDKSSNQNYIVNFSKKSALGQLSPEEQSGVLKVGDIIEMEKKYNSLGEKIKKTSGFMIPGSEAALPVFRGGLSLPDMSRERTVLEGQIKEAKKNIGGEDMYKKLKSTYSRLGSTELKGLKAVTAIIKGQGSSPFELSDNDNVKNVSGNIVLNGFVDLPETTFTPSMADEANAVLDENNQIVVNTEKIKTGQKGESSVVTRRVPVGIVHKPNFTTKQMFDNKIRGGENKIPLPYDQQVFSDAMLAAPRLHGVVSKYENRIREIDKKRNGAPKIMDSKGNVFNIKDAMEQTTQQFNLGQIPFPAYEKLMEHYKNEAEHYDKENK